MFHIYIKIPVCPTGPSRSDLPNGDPGHDDVELNKKYVSRNYEMNLLTQIIVTHLVLCAITEQFAVWLKYLASYYSRKLRKFLLQRATSLKLMKPLSQL